MDPKDSHFSICLFAWLVEESWGHNRIKCPLESAITQAMAMLVNYLMHTYVFFRTDLVLLAVDWTWVTAVDDRLSAKVRQVSNLFSC